MGGQDPQAEELVVKDQANGEAQRVFTSTNEHGTICNLIKTCQQQHVIIDQPV